MTFSKKEVISPKLVLKLEIELSDSSYTAEEAADRIAHLINSSRSESFSSFIVFLLRETKSSMWDLKTLEIN